MKSKNVGLAILITAFAIAGIFFLAGCSTLGISLETQYGSFTYELPQPKGLQK